MARYHLSKADKHDYSTPGRKLYRKLHSTLYRLCKDRRRAYPLYRSYRHYLRSRRAGGWAAGSAASSAHGEGVTHYITELPGYMAGFGHGLGSWRAGYMSALRLGIPYAYSPMVSPDWEETLGIGEGLPQAEDLLRQGYRKVLLPYYDMASEESLRLIRGIIDSYDGERVVFYNEYEQWTKQGDDIRGDEEICRLFWNSPRRKQDILIYERDALCVAVHIRRGDVGKRLSQGDQSMRRRWLPLDYYVRLMGEMRDTLDTDARTQAGGGRCSQERIVYYVFSEGVEEDFRDFMDLGLDVRLCLDMSAPQSFLHMCYADVLLCAPSSFSIEAGAICRGYKLVPDRDWLTVPETALWGRVREDGSMTEAARAGLYGSVKKQ